MKKEEIKKLKKISERTYQEPNGTCFREDKKEGMENIYYQLEKFDNGEITVHLRKAED
jgi:hypothetical protein